MWARSALFGVLASCSSAQLYGIGVEDGGPDRVGVSGRVCTEDAREAGFPVRVLFLVDVAAGPLFSSFDPDLVRLSALSDGVAVHSGNGAFEFAVASLASGARLLAPEGGGYTRNSGALEGAIQTLALPQGCVDGVCRDYDDGLELVRAQVEGDLAAHSAGERSRTQYVVVWVTAGGPDPLRCDSECCTSTTCDDTCVESWECTTSLLPAAVSALRAEVEQQGALSFSLHVLSLPAWESGPDERPQTETLLQQLALAGAGSYQRFDVADAVTLDDLGLLRMNGLLEAKSLLVTNMNVLPSAAGPVPDSDGDGLSDETESAWGTDALAPDTDGDGIGDWIESLVSFDPNAPDAPPTACQGLTGPPFPDTDLDQLNDCEEQLVGLDPTLPDSDGDALIDVLEVWYGTAYLAPDALDDSDWDGSTNGDEVLEHTDPRGADASAHLADAYRYEVTNEGVVTEPVVRTPVHVTGVVPLSAGADTSGGLGTLRYVAAPASLSWQDAQDDGPGPTVAVGRAGEVTLESASVASEGLARSLRVRVSPGLLAPEDAEERLLVERSERECLSFRVRNIKLVQTLATDRPSGHNDLMVYFAESPAGRLTLPGPFRAFHVPIVYHTETGRRPEAPVIDIHDDEFVAIGQ